MTKPNVNPNTKERNRKQPSMCVSAFSGEKEQKMSFFIEL